MRTLNTESEWVKRLSAMTGKRVRARWDGLAATRRYRTTPERLGEVIEAPYSVVVEGEVTGFDIYTLAWAEVNIAGYGRVPFECCEAIE